MPLALSTDVEDDDIRAAKLVDATGTMALFVELAALDVEVEEADELLVFDEDIFLCSLFCFGSAQFSFFTGYMVCVVRIN